MVLSGMVGAPPQTVTAAPALEGALRLPSDKSIAHRALLFTAMGTGEAIVTIHRPGADVRSTAAALRVLGAVQSFDRDSYHDTHVRVRGGGGPEGARLPGDGGEILDCGNSGTTMRLMAGALAGRPGTATLSGDASLSGRPMERIAAPLREVGAEVRTSDGHAPLTISGRRPLTARHHQLPVASAQVLGCLTLAGLAADGTTSVTLPGPTRDHTERMLGWLGASVEREGLTTTVTGPSAYQTRDMTVPGDISSAAAWLVAAAIHPQASIRLDRVGLNPSRLAIIDVLREMGAAIEVKPEPANRSGPEPAGTISLEGGRQLRAVDISGNRVADLIDELPLLSVAMASAEGESRVRGAGELRVKESDRISLVVENLAAIGARVEELRDGWTVSRGTSREAEIHTAGDHRIAIAFAIAALTGVSGEARIDDPACAAVSYPTFWKDMKALTR
jgi:3-phosphoshikimate 1-carboxyvinyltransferase